MHFYVKTKSILERILLPDNKRKKRKILWQTLDKNYIRPFADLSFESDTAKIASFIYFNTNIHSFSTPAFESP